VRSTPWPIPFRSVCPPATDELHPWVYRAIIGLTIWLVLSVWVLFSRGTYEGLTLSVITLFFLILVGIPVLLWLTWRRNTDPKGQHGFVAPFHDWASQSFQTWTGGVSGREASTQILLPIAAVAFGMTIFGLVFLFAVPHLGSS
jgi:Mn2+/Fe2+ NRAMP family transporter